MKKILTMFIITIIFIQTTAFAGTPIYNLTKSTAKLFVNSQEIFEDDLPMLNYNGNTYVPLRKISTITGANVFYQPRTDFATDEIEISTNLQKEYFLATDAYQLFETIYMELDKLEQAIRDYFFNFCEYADERTKNDISFKEESEKYIKNRNNNINFYLNYINENLKILSQLNSPLTNEFSPLLESVNECSSHLNYIYEIVNKHVNGLYTYEYAKNTVSNVFEKSLELLNKVHSNILGGYEFYREKYFENFINN